MVPGKDYVDSYSPVVTDGECKNSVCCVFIHESYEATQSY
jgi:hypothetical protein